MTSILADVDKDILTKNTTIISNVLGIDKGKATALISALMTISGSMDEKSDMVEEETETEPEMEAEPPMGGASGGGVSTSSPYSL